jgi:hypothetical protein
MFTCSKGGNEEVLKFSHNKLASTIQSSDACSSDIAGIDNLGVFGVARLEFIVPTSKCAGHQTRKKLGCALTGNKKISYFKTLEGNMCDCLLAFVLPHFCLQAMLEMKMANPYLGISKHHMACLDDCTCLLFWLLQNCVSPPNPLRCTICHLAVVFWGIPNEASSYY